MQCFVEKHNAGEASVTGQYSEKRERNKRSGGVEKRGATKSEDTEATELKSREADRLKQSFPGLSIC